jgi:virginiamycin B lyase
MRTGKISRCKQWSTYGIAIDKSGNVWFCRMGSDKLGRIDAASGKLSEVDTGADSAPRRMAVVPMARCG